MNGSNKQLAEVEEVSIDKTVQERVLSQECIGLFSGTFPRTFSLGHPPRTLLNADIFPLYIHSHAHFPL